MFTLFWQVCFVFVAVCGLAACAAAVKDDETKGRIPIAESVPEAAGASLGVDGVEEDPRKVSKVKVAKQQQMQMQQQQQQMQQLKKQPEKKQPEKKQPQKPKAEKAPAQKGKAQKAKAEKPSPQKAAAMAKARAQALKKAKRIRKIVRLLSNVINYLKSKYGIELDDILHAGELVDLDDESFMDADDDDEFEGDDQLGHDE